MTTPRELADGLELIPADQRGLASFEYQLLSDAAAMLRTLAEQQELRRQRCGAVARG